MEWIKSNADVIAIVVGLIPIVWGAVQYILIKRAEEKDREFQTYHGLIKDLVQGDGSKEEPVYLDRQAAVIYELRRFKKYYPLTLRTLRRSMLRWKHQHYVYIGGVATSPLYLEAELTIQYIEACLSSDSYLCDPREETEFPPRRRSTK